jgi:hypothetical protein
VLQMNIGGSTWGVGRCYKERAPMLQRNPNDATKEVMLPLLGGVVVVPSGGTHDAIGGRYH